LHYYKLTQIEGGDDLHGSISARAPYLGPLVFVVVRLIANLDDLTKHSVKYPPLRNVGTRKKANAATILPVRHPVDGVRRLLLESLPQLVGNKNLFPPETNDHILRKHLTTANLVFVTIPSTIRPRRPHNIQLLLYCSFVARLDEKMAGGVRQTCIPNLSSESIYSSESSPVGMPRTIIARPPGGASGKVRRRGALLPNGGAAHLTLHGQSQGVHGNWLWCGLGVANYL